LTIRVVEPFRLIKSVKLTKTQLSSYFLLFIMNTESFATMTSTNMYGYEDANPSKLGYEPSSTTCDAGKYGYGSTDTTNDDANNKYGYDLGHGSTQERPVCRDRARRRCSVTEYSLEAQRKVAKEDETYQGDAMLTDDESPSCDFSMDLSASSAHSESGDNRKTVKRLTQRRWTLSMKK
jgi:hypothetical protein